MSITYQTIAGLFGLLIFASSVCYFLGANYRPRDLTTRLFTWWLILPIFATALIINGAVFFIFLCLISFVAFREFVVASYIQDKDRFLISLLYLVIPVQFFCAWQHYMNLALLAVFLFISIYSTIEFGRSSSKAQGLLSSVSNLFFGFMLTVYCLSFLAYLNTIPSSNVFPAGGSSAVLFLIMLTEINDIAQYCWGKLIGGKKIISHISPNKTISGFIGGLITSILLALWLGRSLLALSFWQSLILGGFLSVGGFLGDILVSGLKRDLKIKDFSSLLPAHGGMLDRVDSLILTAPLFYYYLTWFVRCHCK